MENEEKQFNRMTKTPINKLVTILAIPTMISMLVTSIYNIGDTYFVSQLGKSASAAVGVVFSLMAIIQAIGFTLGMGAGNLVSSKLGEKNNKQAQIYASSAFYVSIVIGILLAVFGSIFIDGLINILGSTETSFSYAKDYAQHILYAAPFMTGSIVLNVLLRSEGKAKFSMIGLTFGGILNLVLDPLFINNLGFGIKGAAIATLISQMISFFILLTCFLLRKSIATLNIKYVSLKIFIYLDIIKVGFPSLCRQGLASIASVILNSQAGLYGGDAAQSAMGIVSKITSVMFSIALGIGQGYQPVCGYNYFSKHYKRVKKALFFTYISSTIFLLIFSIGFLASSKYVIGFFIDNEQVIAIGEVALRAQCYAMPLISLNMVCNMTYQSTRKKLLATILSCLRQGVFFIPLMLILPNIYGISGVEWSLPIADVLTFIVSIPFFIMFLKHLDKLEYTQNNVIQ